MFNLLLRPPLSYANVLPPHHHPTSPAEAAAASRRADAARAAQAAAERREAAADARARDAFTQVRGELCEAFVPLLVWYVCYG